MVTGVSSGPRVADDAPGRAAGLTPNQIASSPVNMAALSQAATALHNYTVLEERARAAASVPELIFSIANETWQLFPYRQAFVWSLQARTPKLRMVSGLAQLSEDTPFTVWIKRLGVEIARRNQSEPEFVEANDLPSLFHEGWREWLPNYLLVYPILSPKRQLLGWPLMHSTKPRVTLPRNWPDD